MPVPAVGSGRGRDGLGGLGGGVLSQGAAVAPGLAAEVGLGAPTSFGFRCGEPLETLFAGEWFRAVVVKEVRHAWLKLQGTWL